MRIAAWNSAKATVPSRHPHDSATCMAPRGSSPTLWARWFAGAAAWGQANELREGGSSSIGVTRGMAELRSVIRLDVYRKRAQPAGVGTTSWDRHKRVPYPVPSPETARQLRDERRKADRLRPLKAEDGASSYQSRRNQMADSDALRQSNIKPRSAGLAAAGLSVAISLSSTLRRLGNLRRHPRRALATKGRTS